MTTSLIAAVYHIRWPDLVIFLATYVGLALGDIPGTRLDRSGIALLGAVAVLLLHRLSFPQAMKEVDYATLVLLVSLMVISAQLRLAGFYDWVVHRILEVAHNPQTLLAGVIIWAAILSALFANDVICLIFTPVLCVALRRAGRDPIPYLVALATASNIGSAATLIGNPQNMLIGQTAHLSFAAYSLAVLPLILVCLVLNFLAVGMIYRRRLFATPDPAASAPLPAVPAAAPAQWDLIYKTLAIMVVLLAAMLLGGVLHVARPIAAMAAAGLILISRKTHPRDLFALVDWPLILLFIGLFIVIGDARRHQLLEPAIRAVAHAGFSLQSHGPLAAVTLALSNVVSNVPAVLLLKPAIPVSATGTWYLLAVVSTFAGNLTLLGSIANLIVAERAAQCSVRMSFLEYLKVGVPLTLASTLLAVLYFHWV